VAHRPRSIGGGGPPPPFCGPVGHVRPGCVFPALARPALRSHSSPAVGLPGPPALRLPGPPALRLPGPPALRLPGQRVHKPRTGRRPGCRDDRGSKGSDFRAQRSTIIPAAPRGAGGRPMCPALRVCEQPSIRRQRACSDFGFGWVRHPPGCNRVGAAPIRPRRYRRRARLLQQGLTGQGWRWGAAGSGGRCRHIPAGSRKNTESRSSRLRNSHVRGVRVGAGRFAPFAVRQWPLPPLAPPAAAPCGNRPLPCHARRANRGHPAHRRRQRGGRGVILGASP